MPGQISETGFESELEALNFARQLPVQEEAHVSVIDPSGAAAMIANLPVSQELVHSE